MAVRDTRATPVQLEKLLEYMIDHPEFAHGRLLGQQGRRKAMEMWESLTASLNALGSSKPIYKWQKCWNDWKNNVKKKVQKLRANARDGSSGSPCIPISGIEKRLLEWMTPESVEEDTNLPEAGRDAREERRLALEEKRDAREQRRLALEEKRDSRENRLLALAEKRDAREDRRLALEEKMGAREDRIPVVEETRDARVDRKVAVEQGCKRRQETCPEREKDYEQIEEVHMADGLS
ncbi:hypothetical protein J437_LFUL009740 [Ladona fulva]|uniref:Regulatory protein zeste n=1 Tax=Ladona fulva TaxID=123851 RepID=A0A8K0P344_LADFU|nr:hypothetical protein J437_LFUL009740 [Ladona fulva]